MEENCDKAAPDSRDAFIAEFARNSRALYGFIRTLVPERNDADDVYQSTSMVMWRKFAEFQPGTNFLAWGRQIALLETRKLRDRRHRGPLFTDQSLDALSVAFQVCRDDESRRLQALASCLEKLAPASRRIIDARYAQERAPQEMAQELGVSLATLYRSLAKTHAWLLACIQQALSSGL